MRERLRRSKVTSSRGRVLAAGGALAAVVLAATVILTAGLSGTSAGAAKPAKQSGAATVKRRNLVQSDTEAGTLSYASPLTVYNRLSGTITSLPAAGQVIKPGGTLFRVDGAPVILMNGAVPAYRTLSAGVSDGADVQQLKQNLVDLGFDSGHTMTIDQSFDAATTAAVERWQAALGQTQTGSVTLGSVAFLPGPRRISAVQGALGSTGGSGAGSGASGSATTASDRVSGSHAEFVDLTTTSSRTTTTRPSTTSTTTGSSGKHRGRAGTSTTTATLLALVALLR
ncbi:MAG: peptidoglycan-binding protein, partial [Actinomycetota bacterium]|nr:peptidoglycan-binding protein [Actinomycetota bacterium]